MAKFIISFKIICKGLAQLRDLLLRKFPSVYHRRVWSEYERVLMYRSNLYQMSKFLLEILLWSLGKTSFEISAKFYETD